MTRALFEAVEKNDLGAVRAAVADGARIEARSPFGMRPVDLAIDKGHYEIAHYLLSLHNVREAANAAGGEGATPPNPLKATEGGTPTSDTAAGLSPQPLPPPPPAVEPPSPAEVLVTSTLEKDPAATVQPAVPVEPAAPPRDLTPSADADADAEPAKAPGDKRNGILSRTSSRIKQAAHTFDETFDTFLGGWFFRWMGRKLAGSKHQDADDGTVAVADLAISDRPIPPSVQAPAATPSPAPDSLSASAAEVALPAASPIEAPSPETVEPMVTGSVSDHGMPAAAPIAAPQPIASPVAVAPEPPLNEGSAPPLPAVAVATRAVPDYQSKPTTAPRAMSPTPPPAPAFSPSPARRTVDPVPPVAAAADPFAPDAVAPGTRHPVIGEKPPTPPPAPPVDRPLATTRETSSLPASTTAEASAKLAATPAKPAPSGRTSPVQKKAEPAITTTKEADAQGGARPAAAANPTGLLDQLAETPKPEVRASMAAKEGRPLGLEGPPDAVDVAPVRTAMVSTPAPTRKTSDSVLSLGNSIYITAAMPPESADPSERNFCVKKSRGAVVFCVEPVDWPAKLSRQLRVNSIMYQGAQAIVRYDNGTATRIHAIFPTESHAALITHYTQRFGKPTATSEHAITPFAQPRQANQVVSWERIDPLTHEKTTLEIRRYDDTRGSFPDMRYGAILLYNTASPPIFPVLSTLDLMPTSAQ